MCTVAGGKEPLEVSKLMRKLWSDHIGWTRCYVISAIADLPDKQATTERLLKNQEDIGNAIAKFYGADAGAALTALLKDHILIAADIVAAAKANDTAKFEELNKKWHVNADDISRFLNKANPDWSFDEMRSMMYDHLALLTKEVQSRLKQDWVNDIAAADSSFEQANHMADMFTAGIAKQFPDKVA